MTTHDTPADAGAARPEPPAEQIGRHLQRLLATVPLRSLSLHNAEGELLWLSEGTFGPDEHGFVLDALDAFELEPDRTLLTRRLADGADAAFVCARTGSGARCGLAALMLDGRVGAAIEAVLGSPRVAAAMRRLAAALSGTADDSPLAATSPGMAARGVTAAAAADPATSAADPVPEAAAGSQGLLHARRYTRLRTGGSMRRHEIEHASDAGATGGAAADSMAAGDLAVALRVIEHLRRRRADYDAEPASFALPLGPDTIDDDTFVTQLAAALQRAELPADRLGFVIPAATWAVQPDVTERFAAFAAARGCFIVLDDFNLRDAGFALLRLPAVRCVKIEAMLIARVMSDKFSQATVAAIVQAARVLGLHCVAKGVDSTALAQWLAAAGVEFSDGRARATSASTMPRAVLGLL